MTGVNHEDDTDEVRVPLVDEQTGQAIANVLRARGISHIVLIYRNVWPNGQLETPSVREPESLAAYLQAFDKPEGFR